MYKTLKWMRVAGTLLFMALLVLTILSWDFSTSVTGRRLMSSQIVVSILAHTMLWVIMWILITLIFGRIYCSSVCPLGTMQDISSRLGRWLSRGAAKRYHYSRPYNGLRFPIPVIVGFCLFAGLTIVVKLTDPYTLFSKIVIAIARPTMIGVGSLSAAALVFLIVNTIAWRKGRLYCNTVCPVGGFLALLSRNPVYRIDINTDKCIHCGKCEDVCKSECIDLQDCTVDNSRCVMCFNCTAICPNSAIIVRKGRFKLSTPLMQKAGSAQAHTAASISDPAMAPKPVENNKKQKS